MAVRLSHSLRDNRTAMAARVAKAPGRGGRPTPPANAFGGVGPALAPQAPRLGGLKSMIAGALRAVHEGADPPRQPTPLVGWGARLPFWQGPSWPRRPVTSAGHCPPGTLDHEDLAPVSPNHGAMGPRHQRRPKMVRPAAPSQEQGARRVRVLRLVPGPIIGYPLSLEGRPVSMGFFPLVEHLFPEVACTGQQRRHERQSIPRRVWNRRPARSGSPPHRNLFGKIMLPGTFAPAGIFDL
jgi:hypothetical protein